MRVDPRQEKRQLLYALYCRDAKQRARIQSALPASSVAVATDNWYRFTSAATDAECSVVLVEWLSHDALIQRLAAFRRHLPIQPLVLVTHKDADNARRLRDVPVDEVVWWEEIQKALLPAVIRARANSLLARLATALENAAHLPTPLRTALAHGCRSDPPPRSIPGLAALFGCSRSTLWYQWHKVAGCDPALRLEDFLDWLLLLRATGQKISGRPWSAVAAELGVHEHTLGRLAHRLAGVRLRDLSGNGQQIIAERFTGRVLHCLLAAEGDAVKPDLDALLRYPSGPLLIDRLTLKEFT